MPSSISSPGYLLDLLCWLQFETLFTVFLGKSWIWRLDVYVKLIRWTGSKISQHELGRYLLNIGTYLGYWFLFPTWQFVCNTNEITYLNYLLKTILQFQYPIFWSIVLQRCKWKPNFNRKRNVLTFYQEEKSKWFFILVFWIVFDSVFLLKSIILTEQKISQL